MGRRQNLCLQGTSIPEEDGKQNKELRWEDRHDNAIKKNKAEKGELMLEQDLLA